MAKFTLSVNTDRFRMLVMVYSGKIAPWEQYPKILRFEDVQNPLLVIQDFFATTGPKEHRRKFKEWRQYVNSRDYYNDHSCGPGALLLIHDNNIGFMEALHLLLWEVKNNNSLGWSSVTEERLGRERHEWSYFPSNLTYKELIDPYQALNKCFKRIKPQQYRDCLHQWLYMALCNEINDIVMKPDELIKVYENMLRLYSAGWLIYQR
jgi:hypothetical protein